MNVEKHMKNKIILFGILLVSYIIFIISYFNKYNVVISGIKKGLEKPILTFGFWEFITTYEIGVLISVISIFLILLLSVGSFIEEKSIDLKKIWSFSLVVPVVWIILLIISFVLFNDLSLSERVTSGAVLGQHPFQYVSNNYLNLGAFLFTLLKILMTFIFSMNIINIGLIMGEKINNEYLLVVSSFITILFTEYLFELVTSTLINAELISNKLSGTFSFINLILIDQTGSLFNLIMFGITFLIISSYVVIKTYTKKLLN